jgi:CRISPR/Cas system-associated endoribonuclease Cas2
MVYDINEKRVNKVLKIARKYLTWVQNSVLEGEITEAKFLKLKWEKKKERRKLHNAKFPRDRRRYKILLSN